MRLALLGGSNAYGQGVRVADTFGEVMEHRLAERAGRTVEVVNAAQKGYASLQLLILYRYLVLDYHPDIAVFYLVRNDILQNYGAYTLREMYEMATDPSRRLVQTVDRRLSRVRVYRAFSAFIRGAWDEWTALRGAPRDPVPTKSVEDFKKISSTSPPSPATMASSPFSSWSISAPTTGSVRDSAEPTSK
ncbi:MAG: SGNH/GDSL hydrolase family protein [Deltaproteobacteria bacterium]|nr:SGNH/GDSL hydrolase family protein [Deltaproteobacteria bacterium]